MSDDDSELTINPVPPSANDARKLLEATQTALLATNQQLRESNDALRQQTKERWSLPQIALGLIAALGLWRGLSESGIAGRLSTLDKEVRDNSTHTRGTLVEVKEASAMQKAVQKLMSSVDAKAHRVITLLNIAQDQLYAGKSPHRALTYLKDAAEAVEDAEVAIKLGTEDQGVVKSLSPVVLELADSINAMKAECYLALGDEDELAAVAALLTCPIDVSCANHEGYYYKGLTELLEFSRTDDVGKSNLLLASAASDFREAQNREGEAGQRHPSSLFLAAIDIVRRDYRSAKAIAEKFIATPGGAEDRTFLPNRIKTLKELASRIGRIAGFLRGDEGVLVSSEACRVGENSISQFEAELLESLLERVILDRDQLVNGQGDDTAAQMLGNYCLSTIVFLKSSCGAADSGECGSGSAGCGGEPSPRDSEVEELQREYKLHPVYSVGAVSTDSALGQVFDDKLLMAYMRMTPSETETRTLTLEVDGTEDKELKVKLPSTSKTAKSNTGQFLVTIPSKRTLEQTTEWVDWKPEVQTEWFELSARNNLPRRCYVPIALDLPTPAPPTEPAAPEAPEE